MEKYGPFLFLLTCLCSVVLLGIFTPATWSPYVAGIGIGVLSWLTFLISDKPLGTSSTPVRFAGFIQRLFNRKSVDTNEYYQQEGVKIEWQMLLVAGILIGGFISAFTSGTFQFRWLPEMWKNAFGANIPARLAVALLGGVLMAFGARWAGGCTSGHGISQTLQMSLAGWIASICFFAAGIAAAITLYAFVGGGAQ